MKKAELFESIFNYSQRLKKEYAEYVAYCEKKMGKQFRKPSGALENAIVLMLYALKRNMVINRTTISTMLDLASKGELPPPKEQ